MPPPLLVFDLDGTLADTAPDLIATLAIVLPRHGFGFEPEKCLRDGIGQGARHLIENALQRKNEAVDASALDRIHADFLAHYEANICVGTVLYPGLAALLDRLAADGWLFAICTNKPERLSRLLLDQLGVAKRFVAICGGDTFATRKPHPAHLFGSIAAAGGSPSACVMIGDSRTDLDTSRAAKIPFAGVTFGYTPEPMRTLDPDLLVDNFDELTSASLARLLEAPIQAVVGGRPR